MGGGTSRHGGDVAVMWPVGRAGEIKHIDEQMMSFFRPILPPQTFRTPAAATVAAPVLRLLFLWLSPADERALLDNLIPTFSHKSPPSITPLTTIHTLSCSYFREKDSTRSSAKHMCQLACHHTHPTALQPPHTRRCGLNGCPVCARERPEADRPHGRGSGQSRCRRSRVCSLPSPSAHLAPRCPWQQKHPCIRKRRNRKGDCTTAAL